MKKERKDKDFIKSAYYEGGRAALENFVKKELRYPKEALAAKIEGTVSVRYTVDYKGKVVDANIVSGLGHGCDEEALRIVRSLVFKVPNDGKIKSKYTRKLHIHFRLPGSPTLMAAEVAAGRRASLPGNKKISSDQQSGPISYQYHITAKSSVISKSVAKKPVSYDIKITLPPKATK